MVKRLLPNSRYEFDSRIPHIVISNGPSIRLEFDSPYPHYKINNLKREDPAIFDGLSH